MKTSILNTALVALFTLFSTGSIFAQDTTTVTANNTDISDNLDLQAVASIFGESTDLEDFERRLNNPSNQISNLDLNGDNRVDYLRVIEATENNTHLIILQAVLAVDTYQDVATIEVERDSNNNVSVQVVGDVYMYGSNYIYEPVYAVRPPIYTVFWVNTYRPYYSPWYWGYYPSYYSYWAPYPVYRYRSHIHNHINVHNTYVYVDSRRSTRAVSLYANRRQNAYERQNPGRSFSSRNVNVSNRRELEQNRQVATRNNNTTRGNNNGRTTTSTRNNATTITRSSNNSNGTRMTRNNSNTTVRNNGNTVRTTTPSRTVNSGNNRVEQRSTTPAVRNSTPQRSNTPSVRTTSPARTTTAPATRNSTPAVRSTPQAAPARQSAPAVRSTPQAAPARQSAPAVRSTPQAAPQRQSAPAQSRSSNSNNGGRRG